MSKWPFMSSLFIEHTNYTNNNLTDVLTLASNLDSIDLMIKTEESCHGKEPSTVDRDFWNPSSNKIKNIMSFRLDVEEVRMLIKKLQEFVNKYEEYYPGRFVVGKNEDLLQQQEEKEQVDIPMPIVIPTSSGKAVKMVYEGPSIDEHTATNIFLEKLIKQCDSFEKEFPWASEPTLYPFDKIEKADKIEK